MRSAIVRPAAVYGRGGGYLPALFAPQLRRWDQDELEVVLRLYAVGPGGP